MTKYICVNCGAEVREEKDSYTRTEYTICEICREDYAPRPLPDVTLTPVKMRI